MFAVIEFFVGFPKMRFPLKPLNKLLAPEVDTVAVVLENLETQLEGFKLQSKSDSNPTEVSTPLDTGPKI